MHRSLGFIAVLCLFLAVCFLPQAGVAQTPNPSTADTCTSFADRANQSFNSNGSAGQGGMLTDIDNFIKQTVGTATQNLFESFTPSSSYQSAIYAAMTLMVIFYGVGFTIGVVQPSFQQVLVRLVKMGILFGFLSPAGWTFFNENVVMFFQDGSDYLIKGVQAIGMGIPAPAGAGPFYALDKLASFLINPETLIAIMGSVMAGGPYGLMMGGLMLIASWGFFMLILKTLRVYAITYVARALILGVAPIFFAMMMFDRTKNMFVAWLNSLINLSLQPILLFTFLSFFLVLIETSAKDMLGTELCWTNFQNIAGSNNQLAFWRFRDDQTGSASVGDAQYEGTLECLLGGQGKCKSFPINIVDILSFLILVYLAQRFSDVVERISSELSNAFVALDNQGKLDQIMQQQNSKIAGPSAGANKPAGGQQTKG